MRRILVSFMFYVSMMVVAEAAIRSDVAVITASEDLQYSTQEIAKDYLLNYIYPTKTSFHKEAYSNLLTLDSKIKAIITNTNDQKTKGILSYFATQKADIVDILKGKVVSDSIEPIVGISEIFVEGSQSIMTRHQYKFSEEERMLMLTKEMRTLLGAMIKYYAALRINPKDIGYRKGMKKSMHAFEKDLSVINHYVYGTQINTTKEYLKRSWTVLSAYLQKIDTVKSPALLSIVSKNMQKMLNDLSTYHSKNQ